MKTYKFTQEEFIADNQEVLSSLYHEYLSGEKEAILDGSNPLSYDRFANVIFELKDTPS